MLSLCLSIFLVKVHIKSVYPHVLNVEFLPKNASHRSSYAHHRKWWVYLKVTELQRLPHTKVSFSDAKKCIYSQAASHSPLIQACLSVRSIRLTVLCIVCLESTFPVPIIKISAPNVKKNKALRADWYRKRVKSVKRYVYNNVQTASHQADRPIFYFTERFGITFCIHLNFSVCLSILFSYI